MKLLMIIFLFFTLVDAKVFTQSKIRTPTQYVKLWEKTKVHMRGRSIDKLVTKFICRSGKRGTMVVKFYRQMSESYVIDNRGSRFISAYSSSIGEERLSEEYCNK